MHPSYSHIRFHQDQKGVIDSLECLLVVRHSVNREYVDPNPDIFRYPRYAACGDGLFRVAHSSEGDVAVRSVSAVNECEFVRPVTGPESFIVLAWHHDVHVVIPRDETFVPHGPKQGAVA